MREHLEAIKARCQAATPGPWEHVHDIKGFAYVAVLGQSQDNQHHYVRSSGGVVDNGARHDAEFIAHSRSDVEYLTARLTALEAAMREVHEMASEWLLDADTRVKQITRIAAAALASEGP